MAFNPTKLPIDDVLPRIRAAISAGRDVILKASPGSGKTTRVPPCLQDVVQGQIWVLEPRRLAARMSATRVAQELAEEPGQTVGWQMRFDRTFSEKTRILFLTEGMFAVRLAQDPDLRDVGCVVLDEFHERHQQTDVAFALCRRLQMNSRPDLRMIIMSATLDTSAINEKLLAAETITLDLPLFPVEIRHDYVDQNTALVDRVARASTDLANQTSQRGHILVFLPGTADIIRAKKQLLRNLDANEWVVLELRGSLDKQTQDLVFQDSKKRKIILATNIAESSLTIPGVTGVIDAGLARVPSYNPFTGLSTLETRPVSKASVIQRSGRAGRTGPGVAIRLFSKHDEAARPEAEVPEILRLDLAQIYMSLLWLAHRTKNDWIPEHLPWLSQPDGKQWDEARRLLELMGIIDRKQNLLRPEIALMPVHPRLARFAEACAETGLANESPWLTAILANPDEVRPLVGDHSHLGCDLLAQYESVRTNPHAHPGIHRAAQQLAKLLPANKLTPIKSCRAPHELDLAQALLKAFPDRVLQVRNGKANAKWLDATICTGGDLQISAESAASHGEWLIALDASSTRTTGSAASGGNQTTSNRILVTQASVVDPGDFAHAPPGFLVSEDVNEWDDSRGKNRQMRRTRYGILTVSAVPITHSEATAQDTIPADGNRLAKSLKQNWPKPFADGSFFDGYLIRQKLAFKEGRVNHSWDRNELLDLLIAHICDDAKSFEDVTKHTLEAWLRFCVGEEEFSLMQQLTPTFITVGRGHKVQVNYTENASPWIEARLQNFFGQLETPRILDGKISLTVHLLAPNMRALQVTTDLASFWRNTYPSLRNEYQRKYPRHFWPENPMEAEPPPIKPPRRRN